MSYWEMGTFEQYIYILFSRYPNDRLITTLIGKKNQNLDQRFELIFSDFFEKIYLTFV